MDDTFCVCKNLKGMEEELLCHLNIMERELDGSLWLFWTVMVHWRWQFTGNPHTQTGTSHHPTNVRRGVIKSLCDRWQMTTNSWKLMEEECKVTHTLLYREHLCVECVRGTVGCSLHGRDKKCLQESWHQDSFPVEHNEPTQKSERKVRPPDLTNLM